ncbi:hypothetical protein CLU79DRAFT_27810 [Phycomyces nitens]|nr:hypothetical protein CLU79DRAFT_27810 [Phycomyces nitens]
MVGEYAYVDHSFTDVAAMKHLQKWIGSIKDDVLHIIGLQAIKQCIKRSKTWLPGLESILNECRVSPILEKQELALELLGFIEDDSFKRSVEEAYPISHNIKILANPNRPTTSRFSEPAYEAPTLTDVKYNTGLSQKIERDLGPQKQVQPQTRSEKDLDLFFDRTLKSSSRSSTLSLLMPATGYQQSSVQIKESSMISSLLALELAEDDEKDQDRPIVSTEEFGAAWVDYEFEEKRVEHGQGEGLFERVWIVQITARAPSALDLSLFMRRYIGQTQ